MGRCLYMLHASSGTAAAVGAQPAPSLFATTVCEPGHGDVRILGELSAGRRVGAGGRRVRMALVLGAVLAIVLALSFVIWERWRATSGLNEGEGVDVVAMSAPVAAEVRQEPAPAVQEFVPPQQEVRVPAATIVELPSPEGEKPEMAIRRPGVASVRRTETRPAREATRVADARASHGATVRHSAAKSQGKRGGDSTADSKHATPQVRRQSAVAKDVEERIDSDVQVIEAIVTRSR